MQKDLLVLLYSRALNEISFYVMFELLPKSFGENTRDLTGVAVCNDEHSSLPSLQVAGIHSLAVRKVLLFHIPFPPSVTDKVTHTFPVGD